MKKVCSILFIVFILSSNTNSQITQTQLKETVVKNEQEIKYLKSELGLQKERFENNKQNYQTLYDGLGNQIAIASFILVLIAAVLGYFVTYYIRKKQEEIKEAAKNTKEVVKLLQESVKSISKTKEYIDRHNQELYIKIKRDHTLNYIDRIIKVPEDISNLLPILFTVELLPEDFFKIRNILKNENSENSYVNRYIMIILCLHFPLETINEISIRKLFIETVDRSVLSTMFRLNIIRFLKGLFEHLKNKDLKDSKDKEVIHHIFYELFNSNSSHFHINSDENINEIKKIIEDSGVDKNILPLAALNDKNTEVDYVSWVDKIFVEPKEESLV